MTRTQIIAMLGVLVLGWHGICEAQQYPANNRSNRSLVSQNQLLRKENAGLKRRVAELGRRVADLEAQLATLPEPTTEDSNGVKGEFVKIPFRPPGK